MWVAHSLGVIDLATLQHCLGVDFGDTDLDHSKLTPLSLLRTSVTDFCQGLVTIDKDTSQVRLVHHTLQEYFYDHDLDFFRQSERLLAEVCLTYLLFDTFASIPPSDDECYNAMARLYPLQLYAAKSWGIHLHRVSHHETPAQLIRLALRFASSPMNLERSAQAFNASSTGRDLIDGQSQQYPQCTTAIHWGVSEYFLLAHCQCG